MFSSHPATSGASVVWPPRPSAATAHCLQRRNPTKVVQHQPGGAAVMPIHRLRDDLQHAA